jgi:hypothetical protein
MSDHRAEPTAAELLGELRAVTADLDRYIQARAAEVAGPQIAAARHDAATTIANVTDSLGRDLQHERDLTAELRRQVEAMERSYFRALAALNETGAAWYRTPHRGVPDEPDVTEPAEQILHWLDLVIPPWPDGHQLIAGGNCVIFHAPLKPDRTAVDYETHPNPYSRNIPLGALIRALQAVARSDPAGTAADVILTARNVLIGHELPGMAESARREDQVMAELDRERDR